MNRPIDLRSDTVTRPTQAMRRVMAEAEVGDDVYGEDPTARRLEERIAGLLGKEAALFVPSGTMANQIAVRCLTEPGDEAIIEATGHSFAYETGGMAALSGVQARPVLGDRGILESARVEAAINPTAEHAPRSSLLIIENTSNRGGGTPYPLERISALSLLATRRGLALHMDGARLWNAHVAKGTPLAQLAAPCGTVSVCLSKGLGAPVGSVLSGSKGFITRARRCRKMFGGGMRQVGILAAAGLYAVDHHVERLAEDHANLRRLAQGLSQIRGLDCPFERFETNIAYATVERENWTAIEVAQRLAQAGVLVHATGPQELRFVTHLDLDRSMIDEALVRIQRTFA